MMAPRAPVPLQCRPHLTAGARISTQRRDMPPHLRPALGVAAWRRYSCTRSVLGELRRKFVGRAVRANVTPPLTQTGTGKRRLRSLSCLQHIPHCWLLRSSSRQRPTGTLPTTASSQPRTPSWMSPRHPSRPNLSAHAVRQTTSHLRLLFTLAAVSVSGPLARARCSPRCLKGHSLIGSERARQHCCLPTLDAYVKQLSIDCVGNPLIDSPARSPTRTLCSASRLAALR
mmetsp:Transcript_17094/g.54899  ORF Transcript_17094/g.54899 Transcript_17094/m.54899 type:complete len:229 (+) Transcript_17094:512-1198(+)